MVVNYRLCNVLFADGTRSDVYPDLYIRRQPRPLVHSDDTVGLGEGASGFFDFATYFNAFSNEKWRRYAHVGNVWLHLEARGTFSINLVAYESVVGKPARSVLATQEVASQDFASLDLEFPASDATFLAFELATRGEVDLRRAYYYTKVDEELLRPVELAVGTTTFRKESYICANVEVMREQILGCDEPVASHFTLHVVDNGRTLDADALEGERVHVHPNPNVGGAGGYTRGMIEAMEQDPKATHVILMDDDVQVCPEAIKRTYNLLSLVRDEWAGAFVSGAMLSFEQQDEFREDTGWVRPDGTYGPYKEPGDHEDRYLVSTVEGMMHVETDEPRHENRYAGWWYCCIPVANIEQSGLPLPVFIRGDDAEYGNRAARGFMTMNGICLWHMTFFNKFSASLDRYQFQRNSFIAQATTGVYPHVDFMVNFHYNVLLDLKTFNYDAVEMSLAAMEDFLKGPEFLKTVRGEDLIREHGRYNEATVPVASIDDPLMAGVDFNPNMFYDDEERSLPLRLLDFLTYNGQRGPAFLARGGLGVVPYDGWYYPKNEIRGKDAILAVTPDGQQGALRKKDKARFRVLLRRYHVLRKEYYARHDEVYAAWAAAREELTSVAFWKRYLADQATERPEDAR